MKSSWSTKSLAITVLMLCTTASITLGQCHDGCGAPIGALPGSYMGDAFAAGDSMYGGPSGPLGGVIGGSDWGGGGGAALQLGGACCGPHWYDISLQAVFLTRDGGDSQALISRGIRGEAGATIVQSTDSPSFNLEGGIRVGGRFQTSALHSIEAIYLGGLDWDDRHVVTDDSNGLYSAFSDFGNDPFGGFEDADQASISSVVFDSELDSVEVNFRRAMAPVSNGRIHVSTLWGLRYLRVDESLAHRIDVLPHFDDINGVARDAAFTQYNVRVTNDLFGVQGGAESVICITPGIQFGMEGKLGLYGNNADLNSVLESTTLARSVEDDSDGQVAFVSDANVFLLWQFHPMFKFRAGYELLFVSGIGTASSNYDSSARSIATGNPLLVAGNQTQVDTNGDAFFHGAHFGFEFGW